MILTDLSKAIRKLSEKISFHRHFNKTINIILHKIYNENKISTTLKKRTLKKLLHGACTKIPFFANGELYRQIDGIATGSRLSPTLANIIMITLEYAIIKDFLHNDIIKFYVRPGSNVALFMRRI